MGTLSFQHRADAGRQLAERLRRHRGRPGLIVVALAPGGVPAGVEVARALRAPMDVLPVRAVSAPFDSSITIGAVTGAGVAVVESDLCDDLGVGDDVLDELIERAAAEVEGRDRSYRQRCPRLDVRDRAVVLVDAGMVTTTSMRAAIRGLERSSPASLVVAVPIAVFAACAELSTRVDELVYCESCEEPSGVESAYEDLAPLSDADVCRLLGCANAHPGADAAA